MVALVWDKMDERFFETGVSKGVLYLPDGTGAYNTGVAWNGLTAVNETPSGAEATPVYADNIKYLNLQSAEEFGATIEALYYPDEFAECDGSAQPKVGVYVGQQTRKSFGLSYQTKLGTALDPDAGYKIHLVYGAIAAPTEKSYSTVNDSPEPATLSWELTTTPVEVTGLKPTAILTIDSTKVAAADLAALELLLYGDATGEPELPMPDDVIALFTNPV